MLINANVIIRKYEVEMSSTSHGKTDSTVHILIIKSFGLKSLNCSLERDCECSNGGGHTPAGGRMKLAKDTQKFFCILCVVKCSVCVCVC